jgi:hypothetical protein
MPPSITPSPVPQPQQEKPVAEEVHTDPKILTKIAVTKATKKATMESDRFINGKNITFKTEGTSVLALRSFCKMALEWMMARASIIQTEEQLREQSKTNIDACKFLGSTKRDRKTQ